MVDLVCNFDLKVVYLVIWNYRVCLLGRMNFKLILTKTFDFCSHSLNETFDSFKSWFHLTFVFSDSTGQTNCTLCPLGYYCVENSTAFSEQLCPPGYYCPVGTTNPYQYPCPKGTYNPVNASHSLTDCLTCPPGQYCESECVIDVKKTQKTCMKQAPLNVVIIHSELLF